ncbi:MAG: hypothetical protein KDB80_16600 [Planctomycetes bacterium]|nr:hypothetical protein [Planctomycetota bacterium]
MKRALPTFALAILASATSGLSQAVADETEVKTVHDLVAKIQAREGAVKSVRLAMTTTGEFPGGATFRTEGTLRVLDATHFHSKLEASFGDEMTSESETVKTPDGVWMRERDPAQGEVFVRMDKDLMADLESASRALGDGSPAIAPGVDQAAGPLGSKMLEDLDAQFALKVEGPRVVDGQEVWTVDGDRRAGGDTVDDEFGPAERVAVLVRRSDCALIRMTTFSSGKPLVDVKVTSIELDVPMEPASFELAVPKRARVVDVMDHPPARAQIERIFAEAKAKGWKRGGDEKVDDGGK